MALEHLIEPYKSYLNNYLIPFFGDMKFSEFNADAFERFISWARKRKLRNKSVSNTSINKFFNPLRMIYTRVTIKYGWGTFYNPFFGFERLPEDDPEEIMPFSLKEQEQIQQIVTPHWKPYFDVAFRIGLRPGEQMGLKPGDIDWDKGVLHIRRAITLDEEGKRVEGKTKTKYSRRNIKLTEAMLTPLLEQKAIYESFKGEYFFCAEMGGPVDLSNLRKKVWEPALNGAGLAVREMKQTRHSFATNALIYGENPLWIAKVMGHHNTNMIIRVYMKYIADAKGTTDGSSLADAYKRIDGREEP